MFMTAKSKFIARKMKEANNRIQLVINNIVRLVLVWVMGFWHLAKGIYRNLCYCYTCGSCGKKLPATGKINFLLFFHIFQ